MAHVALTDRAILRPLRSRDELAVGDRPGLQGQLVVGAVTQATGERADASHGRENTPGLDGIEGAVSQVVPGGDQGRESTLRTMGSNVDRGSDS